ncbi:Synaptosomal-associated protein 25-A, partial [Toxocara canis]
ANEFGVQSLMHLEEQDEKLCYVEAAISNVDEEMVNVKKDIRQMKLFCGVFRSPTDFCSDHCHRCRCRSASDSQPDEDALSWMPFYKTSTTAVKEQPRVLLRTKREYALESDYLPRLLNDAKEEEMDSNLKSVDAFLENLRDIAVDMNSELSLQETKMDKIKQLVSDIYRPI